MWNEHPITVGNGSVISSPIRGIFVASNDTLYVADHESKRFLVWRKDNSTPSEIQTGTLFHYTGLFVTIDEDIYFEDGNQAGRINKWSPSSSTITSSATFSDRCFGLFVDIENTLYCSMRDKNLVSKIVLDSETARATRIAGVASSGNGQDELNQPWGIFVDAYFNLFVADHANHRIQRFRSGQSHATTMAGQGIPNGLRLSHPTDVILDANGVLYIADNRNHRIVRASEDNFSCIAGCTGKSGSAINQFCHAYSLRFDSGGSLYVADEFNKRIQKFTLSRDSCSKFRC